MFAAFEAVVGLFIEISFIAIFSQRSFGKLCFFSSFFEYFKSLCF
jgi:hypothetical protein